MQYKEINQKSLQCGYFAAHTSEVKDVLYSEEIVLESTTCQTLIDVQSGGPAELGKNWEHLPIIFLT